MIDDFFGGMVAMIILVGLPFVGYSCGESTAKYDALHCIQQLTVSHAEFCLGKEKP